MFPHKQIAICCLTAMALQPMIAVGAPNTWTPVVSKIRRTVTEIPPTGQPEVTQIWEGVFFRSHDGSRMEKLERVRPRAYAMTGFFVNRPKGKAYDLNYSTRTAVLLQKDMPSRGDRNSVRRQLEALGRQKKVFLGIACYVMPVEMVPPIAGGEICYSPEYDLNLYIETDITDGTGRLVRHRHEHYDLEIGRTPAAAAVGLPPDFVVQESMCSGCSGKP